MQSSKAKNTSRMSQTAQKQAGGSKKDDPTANWSPEEMFETTMDRDGNPVPDPISYVDGDRMGKASKGGSSEGQDEGDMFAAANDDFD
ncbi:hypothetical protein BO82DRAFT_353528 [Aspergillus uvarum CBS 121591]|uniref:Uncharacterized protein n=1 Tax=Aspergillus uvarum CBS 121591 TaxID=1448315 RepID=A0A319CDN7_9EURO|nr:hypothetical protein BO82DRAFT_353528 [Aspergillus uvarum CBS 121591]PYH82570.1 hypothetical protein BO82DRAFT_353528 [Aspergillus uvarum CBS 121591]